MFRFLNGALPQMLRMASNFIIKSTIIGLGLLSARVSGDVWAEDAAMPTSFGLSDFVVSCLIIRDATQARNRDLSCVHTSIT